MNQSGLTFKILNLAEKAHRSIDWKDRLHMGREQNCTIESSTCFWSLGVSCYWVKLVIKNSSRHAKEYVVALSMLTKWVEYTDPTKK